MELLNNIHIKSIQKILQNIGERIEGNLICDIEPTNYVVSNNLGKIKNIQHLCKNKKKICEIGINACHSLLLMLIENPNADYLLFDLNSHKYTEPCIEYIKKSFPLTKINTIYGNSSETISKYVLENDNELNTYDLCHIDGAHTEDIFSVDYENMKKLSKHNSCVIFDDYDYENIGTFIHRKLNKNEIIEFVDENIIKNNKHFIYKYV